LAVSANDVAAVAREMRTRLIVFIAAKATMNRAKLIPALDEGFAYRKSLIINEIGDYLLLRSTSILAAECKENRHVFQVAWERSCKPLSLKGCLQFHRSALPV
jgi:hypothetical protein